MVIKMKMKLVSWKIFNYVFTICCISTTLAMAGFWAYKFALNEDLCTLDYKYYYESKEDVYPSMSICFQSPFVSTIRNGSGELNAHILESYLSGKLEFKTLDINYEDITFNLTDYLMEYWVLWRNGSDKTYKPSEYKWRHPYVSYRGFWVVNFYKCFSIEIPDKDIMEVSVLLSNEIFSQSIRPTHWGFLALFHYPNQLLLPSVARKYIWPTQTNQNDYEMRFYAENLEIFRRRKNCDFNWTNYDNEVIEYHINRIGCRPLYHISKNHLPLCTDKQRLQEIASILSLSGNHKCPPPCKAMEKINYKYEINELTRSDWESKGHFWCTLIMQESRFKVNMHNQSITYYGKCYYLWVLKCYC